MIRSWRCPHGWVWAGRSHFTRNNVRILAENPKADSDSPGRFIKKLRERQDKQEPKSMSGLSLGKTHTG